MAIVSAALRNKLSVTVTPIDPVNPCVKRICTEAVFDDPT